MKIKSMIVLALSAVLLAGCTDARDPGTADIPSEMPQTAISAPETQATETQVPETEEPTVPCTTVPQTVPPAAPQEPARQIRQDFQIIRGTAERIHYLQDGYVDNYLIIYPGDKLTITAEEPFASVYFLWRQPPERYTLSWEGGSMECGEYSFMQDYIQLPEPVTALEVQFHFENQVQLGELVFYTEGSVPEDVHIWLPPCEEADILVFPTHSDDDALFFGPLISYYAIEAGLTVQTAFMVEHTYYPQRNNERLNGLWEMGVRHYPYLHYAPDTGTHNFAEAMYYYRDSNILQWQVEMIRRFKPLVIVGHDLNGEYGNAGHKVNAHFLIQAVVDAANPEQFPESAERYGVWDAPKLYLHLYEEHEILLEVDTVMTNDPRGRTPFQAAEDAFACHISQQNVGFFVQYGINRQYDCRPFGLYRTLVGYDTRADIMENIDPAQWRQDPQ